MCLQLLVQVFLESLKATLKADNAFQGGWYDPKRPPTAGLRAFGRVYAGWGLSQAFYWEEVIRFAPAQANLHVSMLRSFSFFPALHLLRSCC